MQAQRKSARGQQVRFVHVHNYVRVNFIPEKNEMNKQMRKHQRKLKNLNSEFSFTSVGGKIIHPGSVSSLPHSAAPLTSSTVCVVGPIDHMVQ